MRVALLYPSWTGEYGLFGHFARRGSVWPPLNLALLAAMAEQHGHEVIIVDGEAGGYSQDKMISEAFRFNPNIIGLTASSPFFHVTKNLAEGLKEANNKIPIAIGGPHVTIMKEKSFLPCFDYAFVGEAERSFPQFLEQCQKGRDISEVKGIIYRENGETAFTGMPDPLDIKGRQYPLDQFPFPARHLLDMKKYKLGTLHGRFNFTSIQTMRGCPWQCIFCASEALNTTRVVERSPRSTVDEIKSVVSEYNIRHFYIVDDVMTLRKERILEICDLLDEENLAITFEGSTRANLVDDELIARLAKSGLIRLSFGLETTDPEMRQIMNKRVPLEYYVKANEICNKYEVEALNSVMIGLPGETRETVGATLEFLGNSREVKQANFAIAVPYPGTKFYEMARTGGHGVQLMTEDFSQYRRYGSAVTTVGELTPRDLVELQNDGFVSIYSAPWRWKPMIRKMGIFGALLMLIRVATLWRRKLFLATKPFRIHLGMP